MLTQTAQSSQRRGSTRLQSSIFWNGQRDPVRHLPADTDRSDGCRRHRTQLLASPRRQLRWCSHLRCRRRPGISDHCVAPVKSAYRHQERRVSSRGNTCCASATLPCGSRAGDQHIPRRRHKSSGPGGRSSARTSSPDWWHYGCDDDITALCG
jgi:hypothetical protein